jgi:hypothetical protein
VLRGSPSAAGDCDRKRDRGNYRQCPHACVPLLPFAPRKVPGEKVRGWHCLLGKRERGAVSQSRQRATAPGAETEEILATLARIETELAGLRNRARVTRREDSGVCGIPGNPHALVGRNYRRRSARGCSTTRRAGRGDVFSPSPSRRPGRGPAAEPQRHAPIRSNLVDRARKSLLGATAYPSLPRSSVRPFVCEVRAGLSRAPPQRLRNHGDPSSGPPWSLVRSKSGAGCVTPNCRSSGSLPPPREVRLRVPRWRAGYVLPGRLRLILFGRFLGTEESSRWRRLQARGSNLSSALLLQAKYRSADKVRSARAYAADTPPLAMANLTSGQSGGKVPGVQR